MAIHKDTQGPCPDGFHVPLYSEFDWLITILNWLNVTSADCVTKLHLPLVWHRFKNWVIGNAGIQWIYWTSSRYTGSTTKAYSIFIWSSAQSSPYVNTDYLECARWFSIRAFKDSFIAPTSSWTIIQWTLWSAWIFRDQTNWLISITSNWSTGYTIMDKNLWATTVYSDWDTLSESNCWYLYQRWNNYWFSSTWTLSKTSSTQIDASNYWPWNYYSSDTYITWSDNRDSSWNSNLRWWTTNWTRWYPDTRQHWAIQTFHFKPTLMEAPELIDLVTVDIFWINFSDILNELNKYPQLYYGKNLSEWNLYTEYKSNVLWDWDWSAKVWEVTWRYITRYVVYYDSDTKVWNYYGHNISDYNI